MAPSTSLPDWFRQAVTALQAGDVEKWMDIYAPDAVHEFPFAPEGSPRRIEGREAIERYMRSLFENVRFGSLGDVRVREAGDELIIEAKAHHRRLLDGQVKEVSFVWLIEHHNGCVNHYRDYMNPLELATL